MDKVVKTTLAWCTCSYLASSRIMCCGRLTDLGLFNCDSSKCLCQLKHSGLVFSLLAVKLERERERERWRGEMRARVRVSRIRVRYNLVDGGLAHILMHIHSYRSATITSDTNNIWADGIHNGATRFDHRFDNLPQAHQETHFAATNCKRTQ